MKERRISIRRYCRTSLLGICVKPAGYLITVSSTATTGMTEQGISTKSCKGVDRGSVNERRAKAAYGIHHLPAD